MMNLKLPCRKLTSIIMVVVGIMLIAGITYKIILENAKKTPLITYFSYNEKELLPTSSPIASISIEKIKEWDEITFDLIKKYQLGDKDAARILAYLYTAQSDFIAISNFLTQKNNGTISLISSQVLTLFFPLEAELLARKSKPKNGGKYTYSRHITKFVFNKIESRFKAEKNQIKSYPELSGPQYWQGQRPYFAQEAGSWMPWYLKKSNQFRASPPPATDSKEWENQLRISQESLHAITATQQKKVVQWAGGPGTITPPGIWLTIANDYMFEQNLPLDLILKIRSVLANSILDSVIAVYDSKYTYWVKRPNMVDANIQTIMPTPNHPSYPAGHSTISFAAETILSHYFPAMKVQWLQNAKDASLSRVWGGIHFAVDAHAGQTLGTKVGQYALSRLPHDN